MWRSCGVELPSSTLTTDFHHDRRVSPLTTNMSSNVGLSTPRGSGTSGYVQRNLSYLKPRERPAPYKADDFQRHRQRQPDEGILEHERKRAIEVKVFELRDQLEDEGVDEDEIEERVEALRKKLQHEDEKIGKKTDARGLKAHQTHDLAKAKIEETDKFRRALGISKDYEDGDHWRKQEERLKEMLEKKQQQQESVRKREESDKEDDD